MEVNVKEQNIQKDIDVTEVNVGLMWDLNYESVINFHVLIILIILSTFFIYNSTCTLSFVVIVNDCHSLQFWSK